MNIYYIRQTSKKKKERGLDCGEQSSSVFISELWFWFCRIYCKEENFFMILLRGLFWSVFSLIPFLFCSVLFVCFLYAKINLFECWKFIHIIIFFFLHVKCIFFSLYIKGCFYCYLIFLYPLLNLKLCSSLLCNSLKKLFRNHCMSLLH